jgi:hypothetical protein
MYHIVSTDFLKKIVSRTHSDPKFGRRGREVILMPGKEFQNAVPACILQRKNVWNDITVRSVTKILLHIVN